MTTFILRSGETINVDADVAEKMHGRSWRGAANEPVGHIYRDKETKKTVRLPLVKLIFGESAPRGMVYMHKDGNPLNYCRDNLALVPNGKHSSGISGMTDAERRGAAIARSENKFVGVGRKGNRFQATIRIEGRQKYLGLFADEESAARAYDAALGKLGYEPINFPEAN